MKKVKTQLFGNFMAQMRKQKNLRVFRKKKLDLTVVVC